MLTIRMRTKMNKGTETGEASLSEKEEKARWRKRIAGGKVWHPIGVKGGSLDEIQNEQRKKRESWREE